MAGPRKLDLNYTPGATESRVINRKRWLRPRATRRSCGDTMQVHMTRRLFVPAAVGGLAAGAQAATPPSRATIEISYYKLRNSPDNQRQRLTQFLEQTYVPALKKAGIGPVGVFAN